MRFTYFVACLLAAGDMALKATGVEPSNIFAPEYVWLNWLAVAGWLFCGLYAFVWEPR